MKRVAIVGIQGLPANYGGFETMVENIIGENCSPEVEYTVYCSAKDMKGSYLKEYKGAMKKVKVAKPDISSNTNTSGSSSSAE